MMPTPHSPDAPSSPHTALSPKPKTFLRHMDIWTCEEEDSEDEVNVYSLIWVDGEDNYYVHHPVDPRTYEPEELEALSAQATRVPKAFYQASAPSDLTLSELPPPEDTFVKLIKPLVFLPHQRDLTYVADTVVREARVYERLSAHPHPNICEYRGYLPTEDGRIQALCLKRYPKTLQTAIDSGEPIDVGDIVEGIRSGLTHLHGLSLVHNDINPTNIALDARGRPIIIDFGSCVPTGSPLSLCFGTMPWSNDSETAAEENDWYGLDKIERWLRDGHAKKAPAVEI